MDLFTITILVKGKVQGVFYRQSTKEMAVKLGITGSVKNLDNGNVFIIATGTALQLDQLTTWCKQGPARAIVDAVETTTVSLQQFSHFIIDRK